MNQIGQVVEGLKHDLKEVKQAVSNELAAQENVLLPQEALIWERIRYNVGKNRSSQCKGFCAQLGAGKTSSVRQSIKALQRLIEGAHGEYNPDDLRQVRVLPDMEEVRTTERFVIVCCSSMKKVLTDTKSYILNKDDRSRKIILQMPIQPEKEEPAHVKGCMDGEWQPSVLCVRAWIKLCNDRNKKLLIKEVLCLDVLNLEGDVRDNGVINVVDATRAKRFIMPVKTAEGWMLVWYDAASMP